MLRFYIKNHKYSVSKIILNDLLGFWTQAYIDNKNCFSHCYRFVHKDPDCYKEVEFLSRNVLAFELTFFIQPYFLNLHIS